MIFRCLHEQKIDWYARVHVNDNLTQKYFKTFFILHLRQITILSPRLFFLNPTVSTFGYIKYSGSHMYS